MLVVNCQSLRSGWIDPLIQNIAYYNFMKNAPGYGQLLSDAVLKNISHALWNNGGCVDQQKACYAAGNSLSSNAICLKADNYCVRVSVHGTASPNKLHRENMSLFQPWETMTHMIFNRIPLHFSLRNITSTIFTPQLL